MSGGLTERAIRSPRLVLMGAAVLCVLGVIAALGLPRERTPRVKVPVILVAVPNPGADPITNEREIIRRIEDAAGALDHLKSRGGIHSQAVQGAAVMQFFFEDGVDVLRARDEVDRLINSVKSQFPPAAQQDPGPQVRDIAFEDWPVLQVFIAGGHDGRQRRRVAERLSNELEKLPGVAAVDLFGGLEREVAVEVNPHRMGLYGFSYDRIAQAVSAANAEAPAGNIQTAGGADTRVRTTGKLDSLEAIMQVPLGVRDGKSVVLEDVARVSMGAKSATSLARYGGEDATVLLVRAKTDADVLGTAQAVQAAVDRFVASRQHEDTRVGTVRSQAREIHYMVHQLASNALQGMMLVVIVLWLALGWRNAALISLAIPFALVVTAAFMWVAKQTFFPDLAINNMTLFGLILVGGMVVDGCIIVGENIQRHREMGRPPLDAALRGVHEVGGSVLAAYLTTFAAFAPMFMVRGIVGDFLEVLPIVVIFCLCAAMLVDHFLLPVLSVKLMKSGKASALASLVSQEEKGLSQEEQELRHVDRLVNASLLTRGYGRMLETCLRHKALVLTLSAVLAVSPAAAFLSGAIDFEFFPDTDVPIIEVYFELPLGASMQKRTVAVAQEIEQAVMRAVKPAEWNRSGVEGVPVRPVTTIGEPAALNIRLDADTGSGPEFGMVYVELALAEERSRSSREIREAIRRELPPLPGVIVRIRSPREGPPAGAPVLVRVLGQKETSLDRLEARARQVEELLRSVPGAYDVTSDFRDRAQFEARPDMVVGQLFGVTPEQVKSAVAYALEGRKIGEVDLGGDERIDLRLRNLEEYRDELRDLMDLPIQSDTGRVVELQQVAQVDRQRAANLIRHYDQKRVVNVKAELRPGVMPDDVKAQLVAALRPDLDAADQGRLVRHEDLLLSDHEVMLEFGGETELRDEAMDDLVTALAAAMLVILMILVVKFNSMVQALIVLASVPLSLVGVAIGLMLCGFAFSVSSMIGIVALVGVVVDVAIVLLEFINLMRSKGVPIEKAVVYAGQLRLRPIYLTIMTTMGGLIPLMLNLGGGGEFWQPLTVSMVAGLAVGTALQLIVVPLACAVLMRETIREPRGKELTLPNLQPA